MISNKLSTQRQLFSLHSKLFTNILLFTLLASLFTLLIGCSTAKQVAVVDRVTHDTLYINKVQYDSIYVNDGYIMDFRPSKEFVYLLDSMVAIKVDTMYIHDKQLEYKYKYLHDTCYVHQVDTIPIVHQVEVEKPVRYIPWWNKALAWIGVFAIIIFIISVVIHTIKWYYSNKL